MKKTNAEIEALKRNWENDPCWDIEDTEGFEDYRGELKAFRENKQMVWEEAKKKAHRKLENMVCPILSIGVEDYGHCRVEQCAWWVKASESCAIEAIPRIIGFIGSELKGIKDAINTKK